MRRTLRILLLSLRLTCPACRRGRMFRDRFQMHVRCPVCGIVFCRDSGEITGGMAINSVATLSIAVGGATLAFIPTIATEALLVGVGAATVLFLIWFYRYSRGLWTGILYLTGAIFED